MRPVDVARRLEISTTTLRGYEERGLVPPASRTPTGYRIYTDEHLAYFICVREMLIAFDLTFIGKVMLDVRAGHIDIALWMVNKAQADLWNERQIYIKTVEVLLRNNSETLNLQKLSIGEISKETSIPVTTIRYWEKAGLISPEKNKKNRYRIYTSEHIQQILTLNAIKQSVQAHRLKHFHRTMIETYTTFDYKNRDDVTLFLDKLSVQLDQKNRMQIRSVSALYKLCQQVESGQFH